jgi:adenosylhomocysteinase
MAGTARTSEIADVSLAAAGVARVEWADAQMPVLRSVRERFAAERPLEGVTVAACLHVTPETANLARALVAGGARLVLCAANPLSTQDDAAAALVDRYGTEVHAIHREDVATYYRHIDALADTGPQITMDDGADVISVIHGRRPDLLEDIIGGTEETTTGIIRVRALEREQRLGFPVIDVNRSRTKRLFDNRYGTGQSTLDGILRATNALLAGSTVAVFGYGWCGKGIAIRAQGAGAQVVVCEVEPIRALEARMDGFEVMPGLRAAARADLLITATGGRDAIAGPHLDVMKDGALVCNSGHFDVEVSLGDLRARARDVRRVRPSVEQYTLTDGRRIHLLGDGRVVNLAAAEGNPASVMDIAFAHQALSAAHLVRHGAGLERRVHPVPDPIDREIARLKLAALGVEIDTLTPAQTEYLLSWEQGT